MRVGYRGAGSRGTGTRVGCLSVHLCGVQLYGPRGCSRVGLVGWGVWQSSLGHCHPSTHHPPPLSIATHTLSFVVSLTTHRHTSPTHPSLSTPPTPHPCTQAKYDLIATICHESSHGQEITVGVGSANGGLTGVAKGKGTGPGGAAGTGAGAGGKGNSALDGHYRCHTQVQYMADGGGSASQQRQSSLSFGDF